MTAGVADRVDILRRDALKVLCHPLCEVISVHFDEHGRRFALQFHRRFLPFAEHPAHEPFPKAGAIAERHTVKPGMANVEIRVKEEPVSHRNAHRRAIDKVNRCTARFQQETLQRPVFFVGADIGSGFSVAALIGSNEMIRSLKVRTHLSV